MRMSSALERRGSGRRISCVVDRGRDDDHAVDAVRGGRARAVRAGAPRYGRGVERLVAPRLDVDVADRVQRVLGVLLDLRDERRGHRAAADEDDALGGHGDVRDAARDRARDEDADERDDEERDALAEDQRIGRRDAGRSAQRPRLPITSAWKSHGTSSTVEWLTRLPSRS